MNILKKLFNDDNKTEGQELNQSENEALIDLMLLGIYADNHLSFAENKLMNEEIGRLTWKSGTSVDFYLSEATSRIRSAISSPEREKDLLEYISRRFQSKSSKLVAVDLLEKLFYSDGAHESEKMFQEKVRQTLGI